MGGTGDELQTIPHGKEMTAIAPGSPVRVAAHTPVSPLLAGALGVAQRQMIVSQRWVVTFAGLEAWRGRLAVAVLGDDELEAVDGERGR